MCSGVSGVSFSSSLGLGAALGLRREVACAFIFYLVPSYWVLLIPPDLLAPIRAAGFPPFFSFPGPPDVLTLEPLKTRILLINHVSKNGKTRNGEHARARQRQRSDTETQRHSARRMHEPNSMQQHARACDSPRQPSSPSKMHPKPARAGRVPPGSAR